MAASEDGRFNRKGEAGMVDLLKWVLLVAVASFGLCMLSLVTMMIAGICRHYWRQISRHRTQLRACESFARVDLPGARLSRAAHGMRQFEGRAALESRAPADECLSGPSDPNVHKL